MEKKQCSFDNVAARLKFADLQRTKCDRAPQIQQEVRTAAVTITANIVGVATSFVWVNARFDIRNHNEQ